MTPTSAAGKSGPFTHAPNSVAQTMFTVVVALLPALIWNSYLFGWPSLFLLIVTAGSCVAIEAFCLILAGRPILLTLADNSALLTGILLAMSLPPWAPWWTGFLGAIFAIALAKHTYGGIGQNVFNPAMVARVALLVSFPAAMTGWLDPQPFSSLNAPDFLESFFITFGAGRPDSLSAASALGYVKTELARGIPISESIQHLPDLMDMALGYRAGSLGETSALLILAGGIFLLIRGIISWHTPVGVIGSLFFLGTIANFFAPENFPNGIFHIFSGATFLGAFFIATDYVTSPISKLGQLIFGIGCGILTWIIRTFAAYPEGMAFAVLLMNGITLIIDQYTRPRVFGRTRKGDPLVTKDKSP